MSPTPIYLDNNATTPLAPEVLEILERLYRDLPGNPSSIHAPGREARRVLDEARESTAESLTCEPREVIFTGGGSDADTLAVVGSFLQLREQGRHVVVTAVEHSAVLAAAGFLRDHLGAEVTAVVPDAEGRIDAQAVLDALRDDTILVSMMAANNETGALLPVDAVGRVCRERGVRMHTDAVQAAGKIPLCFADLPVDLLSISAHKFHGPKGIGALVVRRGTKLVPVVQGGGQERGLRSGTQDVPAIAALAEALRLAEDAVTSGAEARMASLRDRIERGITGGIEGAVVNGPRDPAERVPNTVNVSIPGAEAEGMLIGLDREGICCSSGSACSSGSIEPSHVLRAMRLPQDRLQSSLRISVSRYTTEAEVDRFLEILPGIVQRMRQAA